MFNERKGQRIFFVSNQLNTKAINEGDSVTLRKDGESILVRAVKVLGSSRYSGIVYGFEPSRELEYQGLSLGDEVQFEGKHVFGCSEE
jgi:hypothetical protein